LLKLPTLVLGTRNSALAPDSEEIWSSLTSLIKDAQLVLFDDDRMLGGLTGGPGEPPAALAIASFLDSLKPAAAASDVLSEREREVLRLLAAGRSNQHIADELVISINTVARHVSNILGKTGAANRTEAVAFARDHGLL
jgi:DNA-binding CsgD family transcriptional regulator